MNYNHIEQELHFANIIIPLKAGIPKGHALAGDNEAQKSPPPLPPPSSGRDKGKGHFHIKNVRAKSCGGRLLAVLQIANRIPILRISSIEFVALKFPIKGTQVNS